MARFGEKRDMSLRLPKPGMFSAVNRADIRSDGGVRGADIVDAARPYAPAGVAAPSPSLMRPTASSRRSAEEPAAREPVRNITRRHSASFGAPTGWRGGWNQRHNAWQEPANFGTPAGRAATRAAGASPRARSVEPRGAKPLVRSASEVRSAPRAARINGGKALVDKQRRDAAFYHEHTVAVRRAHAALVGRSAELDRDVAAAPRKLAQLQAVLDLLVEKQAGPPPPPPLGEAQAGPPPPPPPPPPDEAAELDDFAGDAPYGDESAAHRGPSLLLESAARRGAHGRYG